MGYGTDHETIEFDEDLDAPLSDFEKMLRYHEMTKEDFYEFSNKQQSRLIWNYRRFGRKTKKGGCYG